MLVLGTLDGKAITGDDVIRHLMISGTLPGIIAEMVGTAAIARGAIEMGLDLTDEELQDAADDFRREAGLFKVSDMKEFLEARGWRAEEFEAHLERAIRRAKVRDEVVPMEDVKAYFGEHKLDYRLFAVSQIRSDTLETAKEILSQIKEGEVAFEEAARRHSLDEATASGGGYVGFVLPGVFPPEVIPLLQGAGAGDLIGPLAQGEGGAILRVEEIREPELDDALIEEISEILFADWLDAEVKKLDAKLVQIPGIADETEEEE